MRVTSQHWETFLQICERHPNLVTNKFNGAQGKTEGNALWANVANKLNGLGLGEKSIKEWRRPVTDWKSKVKAKASKIKQPATQTGGGPSTTPPLTPLEERLLNIMGKKGFEGDEGVQELGIPSKSAPQIQPPITFEFEEVLSQNVLQEINNIQIPMTKRFLDVPSAQPSTFKSFIPHEPLNHKRKHIEEEALKEHDYVTDDDKNKASHNSSQSVNPKKRMKKTTLRVSKNLKSMTSQSIDILKNTDKNTNSVPSQ